jgi:hypothetical protein
VWCTEPREELDKKDQFSNVVCGEEEFHLFAAKSKEASSHQTVCVERVLPKRLIIEDHQRHTFPLPAGMRMTECVQEQMLQQAVCRLRNAKQRHCLTAARTQEETSQKGAARETRDRLQMLPEVLHNRICTGFGAAADQNCGLWGWKCGL